MKLETKFSIGEEVTVMFDNNRDYINCECCGQLIEGHENKEKTKCIIKDIRIEKNRVLYGIYRHYKKYPDATYLYNESEIEKVDEVDYKKMPYVKGFEPEV